MVHEEGGTGSEVQYSSKAVEGGRGGGERTRDERVVRLGHSFYLLPTD